MIMLEKLLKPSKIIFELFIKMSRDLGRVIRGNKWVTQPLYRIILHCVKLERQFLMS
jgi:hypothetical protein